MTDTMKISGLNIVTSNGGTFDLEDLPNRAIALDGVVQGPVMNGEHDRWSFDHHAGCARLITDATCAQVRTALLLGLDMTDRPIYINDVDGDTVLSLWLLANAGRAHTGAVLELVRGVSMIDAHGPAGARLVTENEETLAMAFLNRLRNIVPRDVQAQYNSWHGMISKGLGLIDEIIEEYLNGALDTGSGDPISIEMLFSGERGGVKACIARSDGFGAFAPLYDKGFRVVVLVSDAADGSFRYTVGKTSDLVDYHLGPGDDSDSLLGRLNAREPGWGGGSSIGGSPRLEGGISSRLTPDEVWEMMG